MNVTLTKRMAKARISAVHDGLSKPDRFQRQQPAHMRDLPWRTNRAPFPWHLINWRAVLDGAAFLFAAAILVAMALAALAQ